jgi:hypothetical protein
MGNISRIASIQLQYVVSQPSILMDIVNVKQSVSLTSNMIRIAFSL